MNKDYLWGTMAGFIMLCFFLCLQFRNEIYIWCIGDVNALYSEAEKYYKCNDFEQAQALYQKLAKIDSASRCQYVLGDLYFRGVAKEKDLKKARKYFIKAAEGGNSDAQNYLGYIYTLGIGVDTDYNEAK